MAAAPAFCFSCPDRRELHVDGVDEPHDVVELSAKRGLWHAVDPGGEPISFGGGLAHQRDNRLRPLPTEAVAHYFESDLVAYHAERTYSINSEVADSQKELALDHQWKPIIVNNLIRHRISAEITGQRHSWLRARCEPPGHCTA
jgi:hypothetical protein